MKTTGRNSKIITAYTALATVALGVVSFDFISREHGSAANADLPVWAQTVAVPSAAPAKPVAQTRSDASPPKPQRAVENGPATKVTVASYAARRPAM